jgi:gentisate 1,2-dioxygenase
MNSSATADASLPNDMNDQATRDLQSAGSLDELYPVLSSSRMTPGWHKKRASLWHEPKTQFQPLHWRYAVSRLALDQAAKWIGTELAERRNLLLFNPVGDNDYDTVRTMVAAYQLLLPGEHARAHWHTPNAMRFILDADEGCYSVVNGVKVPMLPGDVLLTPAYAWHSHFNEGKSNAYWIDILDVPLVHLIEPMFFAEHPDKYQKVEQEPAQHPFYLPATSTLEQLATAPAADGVRRLTLDTLNEIKTFDIGFVSLAAGAKTVQARNTASRIMAVQKGSGTARIGDVTMNWSRGDVIAIPGWKHYQLEAQTDSVLLDTSDTPVLRNLGFYREG